MALDINHNIPHFDPASSPKFVTGTPDWVKPIIERAANAKNIPTMILSALLKQESGFNTQARSPVGAMGIAQFMPGTAKGMGVNPLDPESAINGAAQYLRNGLDKFGGKMDLALAAYNAGSGNVQKFGGIPPFKETQNYVKNIMGMAGADHATANQPAMDILAQQRKDNQTPNPIQQGINNVGQAVSQLPQQIGAVAGMNNQQAQDYRSQVDQTLPKIPVRPINPSMPTPQMNSPYYGAMNTMSGVQDTAQSGLSKAVNPFQTGAEGLARLPAARSFSQGAQDVGDVASGIAGGLGMLHAGTTAAKGLYNNLGMVNNQSGAVSTNPFASGLRGPHAVPNPLVNNPVTNPTPGVYQNPGGQGVPQMNGNVAEQMGGWGQGVKQLFDTALLNRDPATIVRLLPQVPNDYKVKFAQMIGQILGQGG